MSKKIAVFVCLFPVLFSLILCNLRSASSEAAYSSTTSSQPFVDPNLFIGLTEQTSEVEAVFNSSAVPALLTDLGISSNYLICAGHGSDSVSEPWAYPVLHLYAFDLNGVSINSDDDGYLLFSNVHMLYSCLAYHDGVSNSSGVYRTYSSDRSKYLSVYLDILYNPDTHYLQFTSQGDADSFSRLGYMSSSHQTVFGMDFYSSDYDFDDVLDVSVTFTPELRGNVDRLYNHEVTFSYSGAVISYGANFNMTVENNSRKAIQYKMAIYKKNQTNLRGSDLDYSHTYDDDPVFMYYSSSWVYSGSIDNQADWLNSIPQKKNKATAYHYLTSGDSETITFKYSQIPLSQGVEYTLIVTACLTDYDSASEIFSTLAYDDQIYSDLFQIDLDTIETVYSSDFVMTQYDDVKYDPTDSSNGVLPFSGMTSFDEYSWSYNAKENDNGSIDYTGKNLLTDSNSWISQQRDSSYNPYSRSSTGSANISSVSSNISTFFSFLNTSLSYFPSAWIQIISLGIISLLVLGIIKAVIR